MNYLKQNLALFVIALAVLVGAVIAKPVAAPIIPVGASNANLTTIGNPHKFTSTFQLGTNGDALSELAKGSCIIHAYANTIAASTTATVDCQAGAATLSALSDVAANDNVVAWATTTISSAYEGVNILAVDASSTAGYITMTLFNGTGGTFTWSATASSSIKYMVLR